MHSVVQHLWDVTAGHKCISATRGGRAHMLNMRICVLRFVPNAGEFCNQVCVWPDHGIWELCKGLKQQRLQGIIMCAVGMHNDLVQFACACIGCGAVWCWKCDAG